MWISVPSMLCSPLADPKRSLSKSEEGRQGSVAVERWLKDRFREGIQNLKAEFDKLDPDRTGKVRKWLPWKHTHFNFSAPLFKSLPPRPPPL